MEQNNKPELTDLEKMSIMFKNEQDIKMMLNVVEMKRVKKSGGQITFAIDEETYRKLSKQFAIGPLTHYTALYIINKEQFDQL